jgi:hypothetical protein
LFEWSQPHFLLESQVNLWRRVTLKTSLNRARRGSSSL